MSDGDVNVCCCHGQDQVNRHCDDGMTLNTINWIQYRNPQISPFHCFALWTRVNHFFIIQL